MAALADLLTKFSETHGTSGFEADVRNLFVRQASKWVDSIEITPLGSALATKRAARPRGAARRRETPRVLVEAHMDEIGFLVTDIEDGFLRFDEVGKFDPRVLPSQNVVVHGRRALPGIIGSRPPHVVSPEERKKTLPLNELFIDVGLPEAQVRELVSVGDFCTMNRRVTLLQNGFVAGKALDDRAGLVAILEMLRQLQDVELQWDVVAVANVNEEDSPLYVGALTAAFRVRPHIALCLDATYAQQPGSSSEDMPQLDGGPCIARGANIHPFVFEKLRRAAQSESIPHQITVYGDDTQTNAWMMQVAGEGIATGLVEIPLRYMHTPVETIHPNDVARAAELIRVFVQTLTDADTAGLAGEIWHSNGARGSSNTAQTPRPRPGRAAAAAQRARQLARAPRKPKRAPRSR